MENDDDLSKMSTHNSTCSDDGKVTDGVVINTTEINGTHGGFDDLHITTRDTAIGTTINQGGPIVVWSLDAPGIDVEAPGS
jgi:hypothetical protein